MDKTISAAEANRHFSEVLRSVREGESFIVMTHGRPVARIIPIHPEHDSRQAALDRLITRLRSQPATNMGPWSRDELYER